VRCLAVVVGVAIAGLVSGPAAQAQVPPVPEVPPEVQAVLGQVEDLVIPVLVDAAVQAQAVSNAVGFALRPGCAGAGTAVLLVVVAGGSLPVSPGFISTPLLIFCAGAFGPGPVDPVFEMVDDQAGATLAAQVKPVLSQARTALAPVRPSLTDACGVIALAGSTPRQVPPPLNRFDFVKVVC
jgi:hypothetical protein